MKEIKVNFIDFWGGFNPESNFIIDTLRKEYKVIISNEPDYLFCSTFGLSHLRYRCVKIQFIGENISPDFNAYDYAIGFDHLTYGDRYLRLPLYLVSENFAQFPKQKMVIPSELLNRKFCSIVVSNSKLADPMRERFFQLLSKYKQVDSGGRLWNNVGGPVADKLSFIKQYKFNIAFENSRVAGYTTEKIMDPMVVNSLPIYWGNPQVGADFNPKSFVNVHDFNSIEDAVDYVVELDKYDDLYIEKMSEPWLVSQDAFDWPKRLGDFLTAIIEKPQKCARYVVDYGMMKLHRNQLRLVEIFGNKLKMSRLMDLLD